MPLSEHEQRILEEIEKRLAEEDPQLVKSVSTASVTTLALRRIRWGLAAFVVGFVLLMLFFINVWVAVMGFLLMLGSALFVYHHLKKAGRDQLRAFGEGGQRVHPRVRTSFISPLRCSC